MGLITWEIYGIIAVGITLWLALVFEALLGMRIVKLPGRLHWRVHRFIAFTIIAVGLIHGTAAVAGFLFNIWL